MSHALRVEPVPMPPDDRDPLIRGRPDDAALTDHLLDPPWTRSWGWWLLLAVSGAGVALFIVTVAYSVLVGPGVWGNNVPVAWAYPIVNFVWWIGIGHAGTFISAFLLLTEQKWRVSVHRLAETMTICALVNAGLFPLLHLGRPWFFYWLVPYPSTLELWPQFKSTLSWDVSAITTYFLVSLLFWYLGMVPDLATARDRIAGRWRKRIYGLFAIGWRGARTQWRQYRVAMLLLAGLATPLVISEHSIVSLDFAIAQLPGWHSTIFPPYFVVGAIYSGLAMVVLIVVPLRRLLGLEALITTRHLDNLAKLLLVTGSLIAYAYLVEHFIAWYSGNRFQRYIYLVGRPFGGYALLFWIMTACNVLTPHLFWVRRLRTQPLVLVAASLLILAGMWLERFIIVVASQSRDFLPSSWHMYAPTWVDWGLLVGSIGVFAFLFLLVLRAVPAVSIHETKTLARRLGRSEGA